MAIHSLDYTAVRSTKVLMRFINYDKYQKWSPRQTIVLAVIEAAVAGLFLGSALIEATSGHSAWTWSWPLVMGFASGVGSLQATLIALHNCPLSGKAPQRETASHFTH